MKFEFSAKEWHAMSQQERTGKLQGEFGRWLLEQSGRHVAAFWWVEPPRTSPFLILLPEPRVRGGTAFFAEIEGNLFCITAAHVYRGFLDAKSRHPEVICRLGEGFVIFDATMKLRSLGGDKVDIATFHVTRKELSAIGKEPIIVPAGSWPPPHPFSGQQGRLAGFPGVSRIWTGAREISFGLYSCGLPVSCAGDSQITFKFERDYWVDSLGNGLPPEGVDLGGMSGGPVLFPTEKDREWSFDIGGVISEMPCALGYETVTAIPSHFIGSDGKVLDERSAPIRFYLPVKASEAA